LIESSNNGILLILSFKKTIKANFPFQI